MPDVPDTHVDTLLHWMQDRSFVVLTGAGISTSSGFRITATARACGGVGSR